jgi:hypothetical protein
MDERAVVYVLTDINALIVTIRAGAIQIKSRALPGKHYSGKISMNNARENCEEACHGRAL